MKYEAKIGTLDLVATFNEDGTLSICYGGSQRRDDLERAAGDDPRIERVLEIWNEYHLKPLPGDVASEIITLWSDLREDPADCDKDELLALTIDGDRVSVGDTRELSGNVYKIDTNDGGSYIVALDADSAGQVVRDRWEDMAAHDPREFACMVGEETLVAWALGHSAGPGNVKVSSLESWLDLVAQYPEEELASYDGTERDVDDVSEELAEELGFVPTVAYRCN